MPDRPGFGASTAAPDGSIDGVCVDLLALVDALGAERFGILAQSGGTPYALGLAGGAGDRVTGLAFVGGITPLGERGALEDVRGPMRVLFTLARRAPWRCDRSSRRRRAATAKDPEAAARAYARDLPAADRADLEDPRMWAIHTVTSGEAVARPAAFAREARLLARPWGVPRGPVTAPVALWVGSSTRPIRRSWPAGSPGASAARP